eukprot:3281259-Pyramimonas_sp.AAC.1
MCSASRDDHKPDSLTDLSSNASWQTNLKSPAYDHANQLTDHPISKLNNFSRFLSMGDLVHTGPLGVLS